MADKDPMSDSLLLTQYRYDVFSGELLVGETAIDYHLDAAGRPGDLIELGVALRKPNLVILDDSHPPFDFSDYKTEDDLDAGSWIAGISPPSYHEQRLNRTMLTNASRLGLSPPVREIKARQPSGTLSEYYDELGYGRSQFNPHLAASERDLLGYLEDVIAQYGGPPNADVLWELSRASDENPSPAMLSEALGMTVTEIYEALGYFVGGELRDEEDYLRWGDKFLWVNNGRAPTANNLTWLASGDRGPWVSTVCLNFDKLSEYQKRLIERYEAECAKAEAGDETAFANINPDDPILDYLRVPERLPARRQDRLKLYEEYFGEGSLPAEILEEAQNDTELLRFAGRYNIARVLIPDVDSYPNLIRSAVTSTSLSQYLAVLREIDPSIEEDDVTIIAAQTGITRDLRD